MDAIAAPQSETPAAAFQRAIDVIGTQTKAAKLIGCTQGAISKRLKAGRDCKAEWAPVLETATIEAGFRVSRFALRPDLFGAEPSSPARPHPATGGVPAAPSPANAPAGDGSVFPATGVVPAAPPAAHDGTAAGGTVSQATGMSPAAPLAAVDLAAAGGTDPLAKLGAA